MNNKTSDIIEILKIVGAWKDEETYEKESFVIIAFDKLNAKEEDNVILVEGEEDEEIYKWFLTKKHLKKKKSFYFINCGGKKNVITYLKFEQNNPKLFGIIDKDWEKSEETVKSLFVTFYSCLENDLLNCATIKNLLSKFPVLNEHRDHINTLEKLMQKVYQGSYKQMKKSKKWKKEYLNYKSIKDFISGGFFQKREKGDKKFSLYNHNIKKGIHCSKYIFKIFQYLKEPEERNEKEENYLITWIKKMKKDSWQPKIIDKISSKLSS